jgi:hypothetical protein
MIRYAVSHDRRCDFLEKSRTKREILFQRHERRRVEDLNKSKCFGKEGLLLIIQSSAGCPSGPPTPRLSKLSYLREAAALHTHDHLAAPEMEQTFRSRSNALQELLSWKERNRKTSRSGRITCR